MRFSSATFTTICFLLDLGLCAGTVWSAELAVKTASTPGVQGRTPAGNSSLPSFSGGGRFLLFVSQANDLTTNDNRLPFLDVFIRDLVSGENSLVSANQAGTGGGNGNSNDPAISANGDRIVFMSEANDLVAGDTNGQSDIFVRDRTTGSTRLVTIDTAATRPAIGPGAASGLFLSSDPSLSRDGRYVVFRSRATNLVSLPDGNGAEDVYLRDLETATTRLLSQNVGGTAAAAGRSDQSSISADGRKVVFVSTAADIVAGVTNQLTAIYLYDLATDTRQWASDGLSFTNPVRCARPVLSADASVLIFTAVAADESMFWLCHRELESGRLSILATNTSDFGLPVVSTNGQAVAFAGELQVGAVEPRAVFLWRSTNAVAELITDSGTIIQGSSDLPGISADGKLVGFINDRGDLSSHVYLRDMTKPELHLVMADPGGSPSQGNADPVAPVFSPGTGNLVFVSRADDLVTNDRNQASDLFSYDVADGRLELLTERAPDRPQVTGAAGSSLHANSLSVDGRFLVFRTFATNMAPPFTNTPFVAGGPGENGFSFQNQTAWVVVQDRSSQSNAFFPQSITAHDVVLSGDGRILGYSSENQIYVRPSIGGSYSDRISVRFSDEALSTGFARRPALSHDGNLVAFESNGSDLVPNSFGPGIYLRNRKARSTSAVSVRQNTTANGNGVSTSASFSPNARWVIFQSSATDLTADIVTGNQHLFARDLLASNTVLISKYQEAPLTGSSAGAVISANSRRIAFANNHERILVYDLPSASNVLACTSCREPALNATGDRLAFVTLGENEPRQVLLKQLENNESELVSVNHLGNGGGNGHSRAPLVSSDGRFVVFLSAASDLVPDDDNAQTDLFLRDTVKQATFLLTPGRESYPPGPDLFKRPFASLDGQTIAFESFAERLNPGDLNGTSDIFTVELGSPADADADGLPDAWEFVYFNSLARDGKGDFDYDGLSDRAEFDAWTNPADLSGVLAITAMVRGPDGSVTLYWPTTAGRTYWIQSKQLLAEGSWTGRSGPLNSSGATLNFTIATPTDPQEFYRVVESR